MPIRINLLAEAQAAEEKRRKDPVKRGAWIGAFCVVLVALWAFKIQLDIKNAKDQFNTEETNWKREEARYTAVTNSIARTVEIDHKLSELDRLTTNRFLWAPVLNALQKSVISTVAVTHFRGEQGYTTEESHMSGKTYIPAVVTEHIKVTIEAHDNNPSDQAYNKYKEALNQSPYFERHIGRKDSFVIEGTLSPITVDPNDPAHQFLTFTLASRFPEVRRGE